MIRVFIFYTLSRACEQKFWENTRGESLKTQMEIYKLREFASKMRLFIISFNLCILALNLVQKRGNDFSVLSKINCKMFKRSKQGTSCNKCLTQKQEKLFDRQADHEVPLDDIKSSFALNLNALKQKGLVQILLLGLKKTLNPSNILLGWN